MGEHSTIGHSRIYFICIANLIHVRHVLLACTLNTVSLYCLLQFACVTLMGPALLDLQLVTSSNLGRIAWLLSGRAIGGIGGLTLLGEKQFVLFMLTLKVLVTTIDALGHF